MRLKIFRRYRYDVALSFAEEDREFVNRVTELLKKQQANVYNYEDNRIESWGKDLRSYLDQIYKTDSRFCVVFISAFYKTKHWSQHEWEHAKARSFFEKNKEYILPYRLDDTIIPGLDPALSYLSSGTHDEVELAEAILAKIAERKRNISFRRQGILQSPAMMGKASITTLVAVLLSSIGMLLYQVEQWNKSQPPVADSTSTVPDEGKSKRIIYTNSYHIQAVCNDGWLSPSRGPGTCSGHGGVHHYVDTFVYGSSLKACQQKARQLFQAAR